MRSTYALLTATSNCHIYIGLKIFQFQKTTTDKMLCSTLKAGEEMDIIMSEMKRKRKKNGKRVEDEPRNRFVNNLLPRLYRWFSS